MFTEAQIRAAANRVLTATDGLGIPAAEITTLIGLALTDDVELAARLADIQARLDAVVETA